MTPDSLQSKIAALGEKTLREVLTRVAGVEPEAVAKEIAELRSEEGEKLNAAARPEGAEARTDIKIELPPAVERQLLESFDRSIEIWREFGLFNVEQDFVEPSFLEYRDYIGKHLARMEPGRPDEFGKGYKELYFTPTTLPVVSESPEELSMAKALETTLREEFARSGSDKPANSLVIQTRNGNKIVLQGDKVNIDEIVYKWDAYLKQTMVHRPKTLEPDAHDGIPEGELVEHLTPLEKKNGGVVRLERPLTYVAQRP